MYNKITHIYVLLFVQNPSACFIKAAKAGIVDDLKGHIDALAWGKVPSTGTGSHFDIMYSGKVHSILFLLIKSIQELPK